MAENMFKSGRPVLEKEEIEEAILYSSLKITSFELLHIEKLYINQFINEHSYMEFTGTISEEQQSLAVFNTLTYSKVKVTYDVKRDEELVEKCLFNGIVTSVQVRNAGDVSRIKVTARSSTYLLDILKNNRSFQNTGMSYKELIRSVLKNTEGAEAKFCQGDSDATGQLVLQYRETDWEFIKRLASRFHVGLIPDITNDKPKFYFGLNEVEKVKNIKILEYTIIKDIEGYQINSSNGLSGVALNDFIEYRIKTTSVLRMGDKVRFQKHNFYIKAVEYSMENGILQGYYAISPKNGLKQPRYNNSNINGISLNGTVVGVNRDKVKVGLDIDKGKGANYNFPYSTMSASPDGSGWYCMPEIGDSIRIYFPGDEEKNGFAISSVSSYTPEAGNTTDKMSDPNVKYLRTKDDKEIMLTPAGITINANSGQAVVFISSEGDISITGQKSITLNAEENISLLAAENISLYAGDTLTLESSNSSIVMDKSGDTKIKGSTILEN